ncbi:hypothetical protein [Enterococcus sp. AZ102]|uniref:hypothetical protein n=1 Tax=unclassified Enterococcus TaxID=2608891 RepID=UPI003F27396F
MPISGSEINKKKKVKKRKHQKEVELKELNREWLKEAPYRRLTNDQYAFLELADFNGYMNILSISGKDIQSMGNDEIQYTLQGFLKWLTQFPHDFTIETTKLPTNTDSQVERMRYLLQEIRAKEKEEHNERKLNQLKDRESLLINAINNQLAVKKQIYNVEFILFLFGESKEKLIERTRKAKSYGGTNLVIKDISRSTKELILEQFNNMNEKF